MLEKIALSISTVIFFVCTFIVNSIFPPQNEAVNPTDAAESAITVSISDKSIDSIPLTGIWSGAGKIIEFTDDGKVICDGITADYRLDGQKLTVNVDIGGVKQEYKIDMEFIDRRNIMLGSTAFRKTQ